MLDYNKTLLRTFYKKLLLILARPDRLNDAACHFHQGEKNNQRYGVFNLPGWENNLAISFSSAVAEAWYLALDKHGSEKQLKIMDELYRDIQEVQIPELIQGIDPQDPFPELRGKIEIKIKEFAREKNIIHDHRLLFFGTIAAVGAAAATGAAFVIEAWHKNS